MTISVLDLFSVGIGPSSSHTVGPMRAAAIFAQQLNYQGLLARTARVRCELFGSLGATGRGHHTPKAVLLGLAGHTPEHVDPDLADAEVQLVHDCGRLTLAGGRQVPFDPDTDLMLHLDRELPYHSNAMKLFAYDGQGGTLAEKAYYSVGGGFVVDEDEQCADPEHGGAPAPTAHPFGTTAEFLELARATGLPVSSLVLANETAAGRSEAEVRHGLARIWDVMDGAIERGLAREGILPGGLGVRRRAAAAARRLRAEADAANPGASATDWATVYAMAVSEENAAGGRVVTAPTNGAAGLLPAVLRSYLDLHGAALGERERADAVARFLLTAGAFGQLLKRNASISGAEVGCQGEIGSSCAMAAAGLAEVLGGTPEQVENAAEIALEHNLGLTCDPVGGLVQIPCVERNGMGAVKAIAAARMALRGDGRHRVGFDEVMATMLQTGLDLHAKYRETARGGLALHVSTC
ncbi:L-serine ammonia-lyase [Streptacidiphilus jiangxiensis]|uniref:L-serine dehydratase n=1 Tax=Streptacidiphilus jiangxiensis TaxID=235985 RepID=A0A1H7ZPJ8_STRJI|nr:L-serine ammonia-lyase [Streptacidiphilus jiangxiensis]SEM59409.1 L-serine dehydratase [Streptacidiphilus jiangxiensis]